MQQLQVITCKAKIRSFAFAPSAAVKAAKRVGVKGSGKDASLECLARLALSLGNNTVEVSDLLVPSGSSDSEAGPKPEEVRVHQLIRCSSNVWDEFLTS